MAAIDSGLGADAGLADIQGTEAMVEDDTDQLIEMHVDQCILI